jgi:hypothetical protein
MTECYFTPKKNTTSATICANCGLEKSLHTIGEGVNASKSIIFSKPGIFQQMEIDAYEEENMWDEDVPLDEIDPYELDENGW